MKVSENDLKIEKIIPGQTLQIRQSNQSMVRVQIIQMEEASISSGRPNNQRLVQVIGGV